MNIKDIAKMTGVSITTVSKIINNKTDDISQETIDKVMATVKKFNYTPYCSARKNKTKNFVIALLLKKMYNTNLMINSLVESLGKEGYSLMLFDSDNSIEKEKINLAKIASKNPDGLIWEVVDKESYNNLSYLNNCACKIIYLDPKYEKENTYYIDYTKMGYVATSALIEKGHTKIACILKENSHRSEEFFNGFRQCLFDNNISYQNEMYVPFEKFHPDIFKNESFTGLICSHFAITQKLLIQLEMLDIHLPLELSLISLRDDVREAIDLANISTIKIPNYEFGSFLASRIIDLCENKEGLNNQFEYDISIESSKTIDIPFNMRFPKITVVGSINTDYFFYLDDFPVQGNTVVASESIAIPGGKGLNQAIGISKLNKEVTLIGKIGKDQEASQICQILNNHNIDIRNLISSSKYRTGKAIININHNGESTIVVTKGANFSLSAKQINDHMRAFENTGICLLQSEIPMNAVSEAARIAKFYRATTILKPASISHMNDEDYSNIDIFIPNRKEALKLSGKNSIEQAAYYFLSKGPKIIIITLDADGVLLLTDDELSYFEAFKTDVIDETGGSDAFISALSVKLLDGFSIHEAIKAGIIAASFCISRFGVSNSLIDYDTLERRLIHKNMIKK